MPFQSLKDDPSLIEKIRTTTLSIWPQALGGAIVNNPHWQQLADLFPQTQLVLSHENGDIIGIANTIPFYWEEALENLPEEGWDWLIQRGISDLQNGRPANCLGGLQIGIAKAYQGQGYSKIMVDKAKAIVGAEGWQRLIIPVRPSLKYQYPLESIESYLDRRKSGQLVDHWLRTHVKAGGQIIRICHKSMQVRQAWDFWQQHASNTDSEQLLIAGLLNPVLREAGQATGIYIEPNVWVAYDLRRPEN